MGMLAPLTRPGRLEKVITPEARYPPTPIAPTKCEMCLGAEGRSGRQALLLDFRRRRAA